jgi:hypothetical protein
MELTAIMVLVFIITCFAVFMTTLAWASRPPRRARKRSEQYATSGLPRQTGGYSVPH